MPRVLSPSQDPCTVNSAQEGSLSNIQRSPSPSVPVCHILVLNVQLQKEAGFGTYSAFAPDEQHSFHEEHTFSFHHLPYLPIASESCEGQESIQQRIQMMPRAQFQRTGDREAIVFLPWGLGQTLPGMPSHLP